MFLKNKKLKKALLSNDIDTAKLCIKNGAVANPKWLQDTLAIAIQKNDADVIHSCIESGIDIETLASDYKKTTILHYAVSYGRDHIVNYLISKGAQVNVFDNENLSALYYASTTPYSSDTNIIKTLVEAGADINYQGNGEHKTALIGAISSNYINNINTLAGLGADATITDHNGKTILERDGINYILEKAIDDNKTHIVKLYVENGFDLETPVSSNYKETMLHFAARLARYHIAQYLISKGAKADTYDKDGTSALYDASTSKSEDSAKVIELLIKNDALINSQTGKNKKTPLMGACSNEQVDNIKILLKYKANTTLIDAEGKDVWEHASSYIKKEFPEIEDKEKAQKKLWKLCFIKSISTIQKSPDIHRELTEIFNFNAHEVTTIILNTEKNIESHSKETFSRYSDKKRLENACTEYNKRTNKDIHVDTDKIVHLSDKVIDGQSFNKAKISFFK